MNWLLKFLIVWFSADIILMATGWYAERVIMVYFPYWWRRVICADGPVLNCSLTKLLLGLLR